MSQFGQKTKIFVAGHNGLLGSGFVRFFNKNGFENVFTISKDKLDLRDREKTFAYLNDVRPDVVILAAAKVGGIQENMKYPVEFCLENLQIQNSVIEGAHRAGVQNLVFPASNCGYPSKAPQPYKEESFASGPIEQTNEPYGLAKLAGVALCRAFAKEYGRNYFSVIPASLYGPGMALAPEKSHVLAALMKKISEAKEKNLPCVSVWGSGNAQREFLFVDDAVEGIWLTLNSDKKRDLVNIGSGEEISIRDLAYLIREILDYRGDLAFDQSKPDGAARKCLDHSFVNTLGFSPKIKIRDGLVLSQTWMQQLR